MNQPTHIIKQFFCTLFLVLACGVFGCKTDKTGADVQVDGKMVYDSVVTLVKLSSREINETLKTEKLTEAHKLIPAIENDSLHSRALSKIAFEAIDIKDSTLFSRINREALDFNTYIKDTFYLGDTHWNYGAFYIDREAWDKAYYHYYKAYKLFEKIDDQYYAGKMLFNMAFNQGRLRDYTGSEIATFKAIAKYKSLNKYTPLYRCYNHLGILYKELGEYEKSIYYHNIAIDYLSKFKDQKFFLERSYNNLGVVYQKTGQHDIAISYFSRALERDSLKEKNPSQYARLLDNLAYSEFLMNKHEELPAKFMEASHLRDSLNIQSGMVMSRLHLSEWFSYKKDTTQAVKLALNAKKIASEIKNHRDVMSSLKLLSKIDSENVEEYLNNYIRLDDSLQTAERKIRNKFERIRFETDEYIKKTERLSDEKIIIIVISVILVLFLSLLYFIRYQHIKNKELQLISEQQQANEEIYQLMMQQQSKMEEGRQQERHRISEELHDGVLGRLFGTRMGMAFLPLQGKNDIVDKHKDYIDELQKIEHDIRVISHDLKNDLLASKADFVEMINSLMSTQSEIGNFTYNLINHGTIEWENVPDKLKIDLYRIIQEATQNILKYAQAGNVGIKFYLENELLCMSVVDDGIGFEIRKKYKGIGLSNMRSRVKGHSGSVAIFSTPGAGTSIIVKVPYNLVA